MGGSNQIGRGGSDRPDFTLNISTVEIDDEDREVAMVKKSVDNLSIKFYDNFSESQSWWNSNKWGERKVYDSDRNNVWVGDTEIKNNRMLVYSNEENKEKWGVMTRKKVHINEIKNYVLEAAANPDPRYSGYYTGWAFQWGHSDGDNFYSMYVYPSKKKVGISYYFGGEKNVILSEKNLSFIDSDYNTIKVIKFNSSMYFWFSDNICGKRTFRGWESYQYMKNYYHYRA